MKRIIIIIISFILTINSSVFVFSAQSGRITKKSSIRSVTVFPGRAMVTRELKTDVTPGRYTLAFSHLPRSLVDRSVRVRGKGTAAAKILDVQVKQEILTKPVTVKVEPLKNRQAAIAKELNALSDGMKALEKKEKFLERLMNNTLEAIAKNKNPQPVSLPEYKKMLDFLEEQLNELFDSKREITENQAKLNREKEVIVKKLSWNPNADAKEVKTVLVDLDVKNAGNLIVSVSYLVPGASWTPSYDLRIDSGQNKATLTYSAIVKQQTGEDWKNVRLTLSTAQPLEVSSLPELEPIYLDIVSFEKGLMAGVVLSVDSSPIPGVTLRISGNKIDERTTITDEKGSFQFTNLPSGSFNVRASLEGFKSYLYKDVRVYSGKISKLNILLELATMTEEITVSGRVGAVDVKHSSIGISMPKDLLKTLPETTAVSQGMLSTQFTLKHLDTVNSSRDATKVTAAIARVPVEKEHIALPSHSQHVFLRVKVKNSSDTPLLPGSINLFFDGNFVNTARLGYKNPDQSFELPLGIDKAIQVERTLLEKESTIKGFFKRKTEIPLGYKITVKNLKRNSVNVVLRDQIPVSKTQKVKVLVEEIDPKPEKQEEENQHGFLRWRLKLKPGEKKVITVKYVIRHPKDAILEEWQGE
jgi:hypothetical protein